ncbi:biotin/lipoyl-binding protein [Massilia sp. TWR1-2-2]|uniref:biotin/lipoyl-binding protein n=1 Tax=Massilia sp. TWR1-2-2 TaxID=2804584 RepID=UPI003CEB658E
MPIRDALTKVKQHWLAAALAVAALLGAVYAARALLFGAELNVYPVERRELLQTVVASGRVETPLRIDIGSQVTGAGAAIPVAEGQAVKAGQVLIELDHGEAAAAVEQARAAVGQANARLQQVRDVGLPVAQQAQRQAEANLAALRRQFARSKELFARGFVGQAALDEAERNLKVADSDAASARFQARSMRVFLLQGAVVGLLGSLSGAALAALLSAGWRLIARSPDGTPLFPVDISAKLYLLAALLATLTGLVAAVTPATRAARMLPVEAIRG